MSDTYCNGAIYLSLQIYLVSNTEWRLSLVEPFWQISTSAWWHFDMKRPPEHTQRAQLQDATCHLQFLFACSNGRDRWADTEIYGEDLVHVIRYWNVEMYMLICICTDKVRYQQNITYMIFPIYKYKYRYKYKYKYIYSHTYVYTHTYTYTNVTSRFLDRLIVTLGITMGTIRHLYIETQPKVQ